MANVSFPCEFPSAYGHRVYSYFKSAAYYYMLHIIETVEDFHVSRFLVIPHAYLLEMLCNYFWKNSLEKVPLIRLDYLVILNVILVML